MASILIQAQHGQILQLQRQSKKIQYEVTCISEEKKNKMGEIKIFFHSLSFELNNKF
jgi:hypothetical protein